MFYDFLSAITGRQLFACDVRGRIEILTTTVTCADDMNMTEVHQEFLGSIPNLNKIVKQYRRENIFTNHPASPKQSTPSLRKINSFPILHSQLAKPQFCSFGW